LIKKRNPADENSSVDNKIYQVSLADILGKEEFSSINFNFKSLKIFNNECFTKFHGLTLTRDKICSLIKKWHTLIEVEVNFKTKDGYFLKLFLIAQSKKPKNMKSKTVYINSSQKRALRRRITDIIIKEGINMDIKDFIHRIYSLKIYEKIEINCSKIFPIHQVNIRKIKVVENSTL